MRKTMAENPYRAPETTSAGNRRSQPIRVAAATLMGLLGLYSGFAAVHQSLQLFEEPGPSRNLAMYLVPAAATAAIGALVCAAGIAGGRRKRAILGFLVFLAGVGGWWLYLFGNVSGWWTL